MKSLPVKYSDFTGISVFVRQDRTYEVLESSVLPEGFIFGIDLPQETGKYVSQTSLGALCVVYQHPDVVRLFWDTIVGFGGDYTLMYDGEINKSQLGYQVNIDPHGEVSGFGNWYGDSSYHVLQDAYYGIDGSAFYNTPELIICPKGWFGINREDYTFSWITTYHDWFPDYFSGVGFAAANQKYFAGFDTDYWEYYILNVPTGDVIYTGDIGSDYGYDVQPEGGWIGGGFFSTMEENVFIGIGENLDGTNYKVFLLTIDPEDSSISVVDHPYMADLIDFTNPTLDGIPYWKSGVYLIDWEDESYYWADGHYGYMEPIYIRKFDKDHELVWEVELPDVSRPWQAGNVVEYGTSVYMVERSSGSLLVTEINKSDGEVLDTYLIDELEDSSPLPSIANNFFCAKRFTDSGDLYFAARGDPSTNRNFYYFSALTKTVGLIGSVSGVTSTGRGGELYEDVGYLMTDADDNAFYVYSDADGRVYVVRLYDRDIFVNEVDFGGALPPNIIRGTSLLPSPSEEGNLQFFADDLSTFATLTTEPSTFRNPLPGVALQRGEMYIPDVDEWNLGRPNISYHYSTPNVVSLGGKLYSFSVFTNRIAEFDFSDSSRVDTTVDWGDTTARALLQRYDDNTIVVSTLTSFNNFSTYNVLTNDVTKIVTTAPTGTSSSGPTYTFRRNGDLYAFAVNQHNTVGGVSINSITNSLHVHDGSSWTTVRSSATQHGHSNRNYAYVYDEDTDTFWGINIGHDAPHTLAVMTYNWTTNEWDIVDEVDNFFDDIPTSFTSRIRMGLDIYDGVLYSKLGFYYNTDTQELDWFVNNPIKDGVRVWNLYSGVNVDRENNLLLCFTSSGAVHVLALEDTPSTPF